MHSVYAHTQMCIRAGSFLPLPGTRTYRGGKCGKCTGTAWGVGAGWRHPRMPRRVSALGASDLRPRPAGRVCVSITGRPCHASCDRVAVRIFSSLSALHIAVIAPLRVVMCSCCSECRGGVGVALLCNQCRCLVSKHCSGHIAVWSVVRGVSIYLSCVRLYLLIPLCMWSGPSPRQREIAAERGCFAARGDKGEQGRGCVKVYRAVCLYIWLSEHCVAVSQESISGLL